MCGVAGLWDVRLHISQHAAGAAIQRMTCVLTHRGPDDGDYFYDQEVGFALGHSRLSILDLSPQGHQPMVSASGRYVIIFNGEVYNFMALRRELELQGVPFSGSSDTEVVLAAIEEWGLVPAARRFVGMFAFGLWDRENRKLFLARDRLGIKPLYFGWADGAFVFGSELKALRAFPGFNNCINRNALALFFRHNCVPAPYSIYENIYKLMPGTILSVDPALAAAPRDVEMVSSQMERYWSANEIAESGTTEPFKHSAEVTTEQLDALLREAVGQRMVADVPLGAFLSGGVDSSTVVALMQAQAARAVKTFSIGFDNSNFDEAQYAKAVARHLGTDHTEFYVTSQDALAVVPRLPEIYDEPFSNSSQIPTFLISQLARQQVTVSLSGDGGDELFAGYNRYLWGPSIWNRIGNLPFSVRKALASGLIRKPDTVAAVLKGALPLLPARLQVSNPHDKLKRLGEALLSTSPDALYRQLVSHWDSPESLVIYGRELPTALTDPSRQANLAGYAERMMFSDMVSYLPDDTLTKVDRASMAVSLEARVPLLDHRVVEFAWRLPLAMKIRDGQGKWILRQVLYRYVPKELIERPKMGFGVPIGQWLRGPLRDWAESLLDEHRLEQEGFLDPKPVRRKWTEHLAGRGSNHYQLWDVLMFQAWLEGQTAQQKPVPSEEKPEWICA
jgi:asparagine synthase (glutamine-hydrolysing)